MINLVRYAKLMDIAAKDGHTIGIPRASWLFVPGNRPERFAKAAASGAAEVVLDLEDAVAPEGKSAARDAVVNYLEHRQAWVRVNAADTNWYQDDLAAISLPGLKGVVLPKAENLEAIERIDSQVIALIESAWGLEHIRELARGTVRLAFGSLDYALDIGAEHTDENLQYARATLVHVSRISNLPAPIDGITTEIRDGRVIAAEARRSRERGFSAKLCIHPVQIAPVEEAFAPHATEREWARRVMAAMASAGSGVALLDGRMIDKPVLDRAVRILEY